MKIDHETRLQNGHDYNRETAGRMVGRTLLVEVFRETFILDLEMPIYIYEKLGSHDWDVIERAVRIYGELTWPRGIAAGATKGMMQTLLVTAAKRAIYDRFTAAQIKAGNEAWAVPIPMFSDQYPGARQ